MNDAQWYYLNENKEVMGPISPNGLRGLMFSGEISRETLVCEEGVECWVALDQAFDIPAPAPSVPSAVIHHASPAATTPASTTTGDGCVKGCGGCLVVGVVVFVISIIIGAFSDHSTPSSTSSTSGSSTTSAAWNIGYRDGQSAGRADARQRNAKMGYGTRHSEATRHSAPLAPTGLSRKDYEEGWSVGYSSGYDSYSK